MKAHDVAQERADAKNDQRAVKVAASDVARLRSAREAIYRAGRDRVSPELRESWERHATTQQGLTLGGVIAVALDMLDKELRTERT